MTTQLRLVDPPAARTSVRTKTAKPAKTAAPAPVRRTEWRLDARTRRVGRAGVAAARRALEDARTQEPLSEAS